MLQAEAHRRERESHWFDHASSYLALVRDALRRDPHLRAGLNIFKGELTSRPVGESLGLPWRDPAEALATSKAGV